MINHDLLCKLASVEIGSVNSNDLVDIGSVPVNKLLPKETRIIQYIEEIKNPYCFKVGDNVVKTQFSSAGLSLQNALVKSANR